MADKNTLELQIKVAAQSAITQVRSMQTEIKNLTTAAKGVNQANLQQTFKSVQQEAQKVATSVKLFGANVNELKNLQASLKNAVLNLTTQGFSPQSKEVQKLVSQYKNLETEIKGVEDASSQGVTSFSDLKDTIAGTAAVVAAFKVASVAKDLAGFALQQADAFDTARKELGILLGDVQAGNALFEQLQDFNVKTPFDLETTQQATNVLLAAKVPVEDLQQRLTRFGDLSQGNTQKFNSFINAFSKGAAKGKADMEVLNVYLDQGIPILDELAKNANTTSAEIVDMASKGQISFGDLTNALDTLTEEGGRYYGTMAIGAENLEGIQEGLKESVNAVAASIGSVLLPVVKSILLTFTNVFNAINDSPLLKGLLAGAVVAVTGYFVAMATKTAILTAKTWLQYAAQMGLNSAMAVTNPLLLAGIAAVGLATAAAVAYATAQNDAATATDANATALEGLQQTTEQYMSFLDGLTADDVALTISNYEKNVIPAAEKAVQQIKDKLETIPETLQKQVYGDMGIVIGTETVANPEFEKTQKILDAEIAKLEEYRERQATAIQQLATLEDSALSSAVQKGNDLLKERDSLYSKTLEGQREKLVEELAFANSLRTATVTNDDGSKSGLVSYKTEAIIRDAQKALDDFDAKNAKSTPDFIEAWGLKGADEIKLLQVEMAEAQQKLNEQAQASFGDNYTLEQAYIRETAALQEYYNNQIADAERQQIISAHDEKMSAIQEEFEYQKALAGQSMENATNSTEYASGVADYTAASAQSAIQDTDVGQLISGVDPVTMLITSLLGAILSIESVTEVLNFMGTAVETMIGFVEPLIDAIFMPFADIIKEIGTIAGQVLAPLFGILALAIQPLVFVIQILLAPLQVLADAFEWFYNAIIYPVGNAMIGAMNGVITALNRIPFVNIKKLDYLPAIGEKAEEMAKEMERATELITKMYEDQITAVEDQLSAQIESLQTQYELGLISRDEYNAQAEQYTNTADQKIIDINERMDSHLAQIEKNTASSGVASFDVGTTYVPRDMPAVVHKGETIVPKTFSDGIRNGEMALVGNKDLSNKEKVNSSSNGGNMFAITINVGGNVTSEKELSEVIYDNIADLITSKQRAPLPQGI